MGKLIKYISVLLISVIICACVIGCEKTENKVRAEAKIPSSTSLRTNTSTPATNTPTPARSTPAQVKRISVPVVKGIYLNNSFLQNNDKVNSIINISKTTELNTVVIDIKGEDGYINYSSSVPLAQSIGASTGRVNTRSIIKLFHDNNIYVIGRVVCFRDPVLAKARADLSFRAKDGSLWKDDSGTPWVNPFNKENWKYIIDLSKEAINIGFDEIQYDYVRFGNEGDVKNIDFGQSFTPSQKPDAIAEFLDMAYKEIGGNKTKISADIFGISAITSADDNILGQNLEKVAKEVDAISPMIYPSHYSNIKQNKVGQIINNVVFQKPDLEPYNVVFQTMQTIRKRIEQGTIKTMIRPYLQAFTASYLGKGYYQRYGASQIREQIQAVYDSGFKEWILWDASSNYNSSYFDKK